VGGLASNPVSFTVPGILSAPTVYYLHEDPPDGPGGLLLAPGFAYSSFGVLNLYSTELSGAPVGEYMIGTFVTNSGVPNATGFIPGGSQVSGGIWMARTSTLGTIYGRVKVYLNSAAGPLLCVGTTASPIQTAAYTYVNQPFTCLTPGDIVIAPTDKFFVWVGVNYTVSGSGSSTQAGIAFGSNPNQSGIGMPGIVGPPGIASLSPTTGAVGAPITVSGGNFAATQGSSTLTFNGTPAAPTSWSATSIVAPVPSGAASGLVKVTVGGTTSNGLPFTVAPSPVITGVTPNSGDPYAQITISGSNFGATQGLTDGVTFNAIQGAGITSWSDTQITAQVPTGPVTGNIIVYAQGAAPSNGFPFTGTGPAITAIAPTNGPYFWPVTITGVHFGATQGSSIIQFQDQSGPSSITASPISWSDTQIVVPVISANGGADQVLVAVVTVNANVSNRIPFHVVFFPYFDGANSVITGITPSYGPVATSVTINGQFLENSYTNDSLTFNGVEASPTNWTTTAITTPVPAGASSGPVIVTLLGQSTNGYWFTVSGFTPSSGTIGTAVTISGGGFGASQGTSTVTFGGAQATPLSWSENVIVVPVPAGAVSGQLVVTVGGTTVAQYPFTVIAGPGISALSPTAAPIGTPVTITGAGFGSSQGTSTVNFNGVSTTPSSWSNASVVVPVPAGLTTGNASAVVTVNGLSSAAYGFTVLPGVTSVSPTLGGYGASVTINGTNFGATHGTSTISFNGLQASSITSWSDTQIVATVPDGATSGPVTVTMNSLQSNSNVAFIVIHPVISGVTPPSGTVGGTVTVTGSGFGIAQGSSQIQFNGTVATPSSWSDTSITVTVPTGATTGQVTVTESAVTSNNMPFYVTSQFFVTSLTPSGGRVGTTVAIVGSGFGSTQSNSTVSFNGLSAVVTNWTDNEIDAVVPASATNGPVTVQVAAVTAQGPTYTVNITSQLTDSRGYTSSVTSQLIGGQWYPANSQGSGCSSCTLRGNIGYTYDDKGNVLSRTDELGHTTTYTYDSNGNVLTVSVPLGSGTYATTTYTYNSFSEVLTTTDPLGNITTNTYDPKGNLLTVTTPAPGTGAAASVTQFAYNALGELTQITDPLSHATALTYTPAGLIATMTDAQSNVTTYGYDTHGNRTSVTDAMQHQTIFAYDAADRLTTITYPGGSTTTFGYDNRGRRTSVTDQNGKTTTYAYDDADRLTSVTDAATNVTAYGYDTEDNLTSIVDANNHTTSFTYDAFGRVTQTAFPSGLVETYAYDAVGNLTGKTDRKNQALTYTYDQLNRLTRKLYPVVRP